MKEEKRRHFMLVSSGKDPGKGQGSVFPTYNLEGDGSGMIG